ncbi:MAG: hypothetical protein NTW30_04525, partial [Candidatus Aenigmarchaeota archaeon]|nr:hypothetical protein [Candidatus Aenigmarchaeota archaeon]
MAIHKKTKIKIIVTIVIIIPTVTILLFSKYQKVEIIYFTNPNCLLTKDTDQIIKEIKVDFGDKITTKEITMNMYPDDKPDTEEIKKLRDKYQVYGVPDIIINGE